MGCCLSRVKLCAATHPSVRFLQALYVCRELGAACSAVSDARLYGTNWAHPCHICARTRLTPAHICTKTGPAPATSAPGRGPPLPHWLRCDGKACDLTHGGNESAGIAECHVQGEYTALLGLHRRSDRYALPGLGPTPATSAPGLGQPLPHQRQDWARPRVFVRAAVLPCQCCAAQRKRAANQIGLNRRTDRHVGMLWRTTPTPRRRWAGTAAVLQGYCSGTAQGRLGGGNVAADQPDPASPMRCVPCGLRTAAGAPLRRARRAGAGLSAVRQPRPRVARLATPRARPPRPCGPVEPGARGRRRRFASSAAEAAPPISSPPPPLPRALPFIVLVVHCRRIARCAGLQCGEPPHGAAAACSSSPGSHRMRRPTASSGYSRFTGVAAHPRRQICPCHIYSRTGLAPKPCGALLT